MESKQIIERLAGIQAYIFDLDGTLINSEQVMGEISLAILSAHGIEDGRDYLNAIRGRNMAKVRADFIRRYGHKLDYDRYNKAFSDQLLARLRSGRVQLMPGAEAVLDLTRSLGKRALATSTSQDLAEEKLAHTPVGQVAFDALVFGDQVARSKPAPDIFLEAARQMGLAPEACLVFEDSNNGAMAGIQGHFPTFYIEDMEGARPDVAQSVLAVFKSMEEVIPLLREAHRL